MFDHVMVMGAIKRRGRRSDRDVQLDRLSDDILRMLGRQLADARRRRRLTQRHLAARVGISRSTESRLELGRGYGAPVGVWLDLAYELGLTPRFDLRRDHEAETADAGHLGVQELILRLGRRAGFPGTFELRIGAERSPNWIDVFLRDDARRRLVVAEAWNTISDLGAGTRSFDRKMAAARELAGWLDGGGYTAHGVWVVRHSRRNKALVARYPEIFETSFPGSSRAWVAVLTEGAEPPTEPGLVWCDIRATRVYEWRRRR